MSFDYYGYLGSEIQEISQNIYQNHKEIFDLCYDINHFAQDAKFKFSVYNKNGQQVISGCLFLKILNGFQATVILLRNGLSSEGKIIVRTILESLFILRTICEDEEATTKYVITDNAKREKILNIIFDKTKADIFETIKDNIDPAMIERLREENKEQGISDISAWEWANKAKLTSHYETAYRVLSDEVHSTPRSLEKYVQLDEQDNITSFNCLPQTDDLKPTLATACIVLVMALDAVNELLIVDSSDKIKIFTDRLLALGIDNII